MPPHPGERGVVNAVSGITGMDNNTQLQREIATLTLNPAVDVSCSVNRVEPDSKLRCSPPQYEPGGGGINVSRAIRKLGGASTALWTSGGHTGQLLETMLAEEGIHSEVISITDRTRENVIVHEETGNQQFRFCMPGPEFTPSEAEHCLEAIARHVSEMRFLVLSGSLPRGLSDDFYGQVANAAPESCRVIVDAGGEALRQALGPNVDLIKPNWKELGQLAGEDITSDEALEAAARRLIDAGTTKAVVASLGSGGAVLVTAEGRQHIRAPVVAVRSRVGAGDSMVAGMTLALARNHSLSAAVRFGIAAGTAAVMTPGTQLCRREDAERLFQGME